MNETKSDKKTEEKFYITTPIFYPNANLHMGHAYTVTVSDIIARFNQIAGKDVYFLTGSDENTGKVLKSAKDKDMSVEVFLGGIVENFKNLYSALDISFNQFIRTTDKEKHWPGAVALWNKLVEAGDIYKSKYTGLYCAGCEAFYTDKDLVDGKCPIHLVPAEKIEEENYFFRLSKYTADIRAKIESDEVRIVPMSRKNEILALLSRGLEDISFSRPIKNVPHGIPVPGDAEQAIYVWCDALVNYISALGYGRSDTALFDKFWPADVHVIGKDILRFHAGIWPAMLLSAGVALPKAILVHGFITSGGHKMSKSLGNVIDPFDLINEYGKDAVRYYFAREISPFEDGDLTIEKFNESYNANLANGIGNLSSRIMKMAETNLAEPVVVENEALPAEIVTAMNDFDLQKATDYIWTEISRTDRIIQETEPFKLVKTDKVKGEKLIRELVVSLYKIARMLEPIIPETAERIQKAVKENKMFEHPIFLRKN